MNTIDEGVGGLKKDNEVQKLVDNYGRWVKEDCENTAGGTARMTKELFPYDELFSPIHINNITIKNRVIMGPMGNLNMCDETGRPNDKMLQYFFARAKGGTGLLTTGLIPVSHGIDNTVTENRKLTVFPRIDGSRSVLAGWRDLAQGVHGYGSKIFVQITPGLGRVGPPTCLINQKKFPVSASFNPNFYIPRLPCMRLSDSKLKKIIKNCGQAAIDAKECGLDGVYLHGHEGYLLEQLTNTAFNRRKLGRYSDWQAFGIDIIKEIRKRTGAKYPIMYRIDLSLALNETYGSHMNNTKSLSKFINGRRIKDTLIYMENLIKAGVDIFDVDLGCYDNWWLPHPPASMPAGCFLEISRIVKEYFEANNIKSNMGIEVPVVAVGKLGYPDIAEKAIKNGDCDMVMLARPLLSDPEWCNKAYSGKIERIIPCIGCQEGCINEFIEGGHPQCAVNPRTGFEDVIPKIPSKPEKIKNICVVGAGPAGILFAITAAKRGHNIELIEKSGEIGGKVNPGSVAKIKYDFWNYLKYLQEEVEVAKKMPNFQVRLNTEVNTKWLKEQKYDAIIFAYGSKNILPKLPGIEKITTVQATDLLSNPNLMGDADKVVVIGGGVVGCETAFWLKYEYNRNVKVVEMQPNLMQGVCTANRGHLIHYLNKGNVELINCAKVISFEKGKVNIKKNVSKGVPNPYNTWQPLLPNNIHNPLAKKIGEETKDIVLEADLVVLSIGTRADEDLFFKAQKQHLATELYNIGDSYRAGRVLEATRSAYNLATHI
ncbi:oxidoreductase [Vallitalea sp.]|jgi:2-enoate reductase|uniref:oxidoreductase n=1 Tax=Vallitalea sp. TaxID=1882829 RepID=UPI0025F661EE|nr:FAD-dependent oxidoreductase [Vallitalea sp.]MCT4687100.1 NAD(P)/FAD-dependent oxidoreductase [Vallitalea sp.]